MESDCESYDKAIYKFEENILALSTTNNVDELHREWAQVSKYTDPNYESNHDTDRPQCVCNRLLKKEVFVCHNKSTNKFCFLGSKCIKRIKLKKGTGKVNSIMRDLMNCLWEKGEYKSIKDLNEYSDNIRNLISAHILSSLDTSFEIYKLTELLNETIDLRDNNVDKTAETYEVYNNLIAKIENKITTIQKGIELKKKLQEEENKRRQEERDSKRLAELMRKEHERRDAIMKKEKQDEENRIKKQKEIAENKIKWEKEKEESDRRYIEYLEQQNVLKKKKEEDEKIRLEQQKEAKRLKEEELRVINAERLHKEEISDAETKKAIAEYKKGVSENKKNICKCNNEYCYICVCDEPEFDSDKFCDRCLRYGYRRC